MSKAYERVSFKISLCNAQSIFGQSSLRSDFLLEKFIHRCSMMKHGRSIIFSQNSKSLNRKGTKIQMIKFCLYTGVCCKAHRHMSSLTTLTFPKIACWGYTVTFPHVWHDTQMCNHAIRVCMLCFLHFSICVYLVVSFTHSLDNIRHSNLCFQYHQNI